MSNPQVLPCPGFQGQVHQPDAYPRYSFHFSRSVFAITSRTIPTRGQKHKQIYVQKTAFPARLTCVVPGCHLWYMTLAVKTIPISQPIVVIACIVSASFLRRADDLNAILFKGPPGFEAGSGRLPDSLPKED